MQMHPHRPKHQRKAPQGLAARSESIGCGLQVARPEDPAEQESAYRSREHRHPATYWEAWAIGAIYLAGVVNALLLLLQ